MPQVIVANAIAAVTTVTRRARSILATSKLQSGWQFRTAGPTGVIAEMMAYQDDCSRGEIWPSSADLLQVTRLQRVRFSTFVVHRPSRRPAAPARACLRQGQD